MCRHAGSPSSSLFFDPLAVHGPTRPKAARDGRPSAGTIMNEPHVTQAGTSPRSFRYWIERGGDGAGAPGAVMPDARGGWYDDWTRLLLQRWAARRVQRHGGARFRRAVDLGCGYGDWAQYLATIADDVTAVDISPGFVAQTEARLAATGHASWRTAAADIRRFDDYRDADLIHLGGVFTYLEDDEVLDTLATARARIAPGGLLHQRDWCAVNFGRTSRQMRDELFSVHRTPAQYVALARRAGFELLEVRRSPAIYGEQMAFQTIGLRSNGVTRAVGWLPALLWRSFTMGWTRCSVTLFFRPS
jgi:SAM-dependent methyltransferase